MIPPIRRWSAPIECATLPPAALPPRYRAPGPGGPTSTPQTRTRPPTPESYAPATFFRTVDAPGLLPDSDGGPAGQEIVPARAR